MYNVQTDSVNFVKRHSQEKQNKATFVYEFTCIYKVGMKNIWKLLLITILGIAITCYLNSLIFQLFYTFPIFS